VIELNFLTYILAFIGAALGFPLAWLAARRSTHQPISYDLDAESRIFRSIAADPTLYLRVLELQVDDFADPNHKKQWASLQQRFALITAPEKVLSELEAETWITSQLLTHSDLFSDALELPQSYEKAPERDSLAKSVVADAQLVLAASNDRNLYNGHSPIIQGGEGNPILIRQLIAPSTFRITLTIIINAGSWSITPILAQAAANSTLSQFFVIISLCLLASSSLLWALVDIDTMYLDTPTFWPGAIIAWGLAVCAAVADYDLSRLLPGVLIALGGAMVFELANLGYRIVRGSDGMGGGDTLILLATAGVPAALFGSWSLGYYAALGSLILGVIGWIILFILGKVTRATPYPFGPYLALGWILATLLWVIVL
jgi:prepilin signal peptidase PulO-like enzyme (type II secretory pathway)